MIRALVLVAVVAAGARATAEAPKPTEVWLRGKAGKLQAWLWRPAGAGPFPALVYNHGSEKDPIVGTDGQVGTFFVNNGYVVLSPYRRGAGKSEGRHWDEGLDGLPDDVEERRTIERLVEDSDDVVTAIEWLRAQPWVKRDDIAAAAAASAASRRCSPPSGRCRGCARRSTSRARRCRGPIRPSCASASWRPSSTRACPSSCKRRTPLKKV